MRYHLIIWLESSECWHTADTLDVAKRRRDPLRYAIAVLRNTHPRLTRGGHWAVVADVDLAEALATDPRKSVFSVESILG